MTTRLGLLPVVMGDTEPYPVLVARDANGDPANLVSVIVFTQGGTLVTVPGPSVAIIDPRQLWASVSEVMTITPDANPLDALVAIVAAEAAVRAWVTTPIDFPVSGRAREAVSLLAARALTATSGADAGAIMSEQVGD